MKTSYSSLGNADPNNGGGLPHRIETMMMIACLVMAIFISWKYFPGFEAGNAYAGNTLQVLYPETFSGDIFRDPERPLSKRPYQLSLLYALVKLTGEIWLDDRFVIVVYVGLVFAGFLGIDRIAKLFGLNQPIERLLILMLFMKDHQIYANKVMLAHHPDVNHVAFAIPLIIWLMYFTLSRKGLVPILAISTLLILVSIRVGVLPVAIALSLRLLTGTRRERIIIGILFSGGLVVAYIGLFHVFTMTDEVKRNLWELIKNIEHGSANPFHIYSNEAIWPVIVRNVLFVGLCLGALFIPKPPTKSFNIFHRLILLGLVLWLVAGLYISFSPEFMKLPLLISLSPARALGVIQNLAYIGIGCATLIWLKESQNGYRVALSATIFVVLLLIGLNNLNKWLILTMGAVCLTLLAHYVIFRKSTEPPLGQSGFISYINDRPAKLFLHVFTLIFAIYYAVAIWQKAPAWAFTIRHGVWGEAASAKWVGIAEYIRNNTPQTASVLPLYFPVDPTRGPGLVADASLAVRAGRPMPIPVLVSDLMNPERWKLEQSLTDTLKKIGLDFINHDLKSAGEGIKNLRPVPDYIVVPTKALGRLDEPRFPYIIKTKIRDYTILIRAING